MAWSIGDLQKEISTREQYGIPTKDLQSQLNSMYKNAFSNYTYAPGSAQGPATLQQASTANQTGGVNIAPAPATVTAPKDNQGGGTTTGQQGQGTTGFTQADIDKAYSDAESKFKTQAESLRDARIKNAIAGLQNKYNQTISDINAKRTALDPTYDAKRLQAQSSSALQAKNFAEFLMNRGLSRSGIAQQAAALRNLGLQQTFNQYDAQKKADQDYLTKMETQAQQALANDKIQAENEAETTYLNNFLQYKAQQDANMRNEMLKRDEMKINNQNKQDELLQKKYEAMEKKRTDAEAAINKREIDTYGFNLNPTQRNMLESFNNAMQNPQFAQAYNQAYNSDGGIAGLMKLAKDQGREDWVQALEGGRFNKILNEGMTQYGGQYALPQKWYQNAYDTESKGAKARTDMIKSQFAFDLENLGLEKLATDVRNGKLDGVKKEIEVSYLPDEKKAELMNKYANIEQTQMQTKYIPINSAISQQNANTSAYSAQISKMNADTNRGRLLLAQQEALNPKDKSPYFEQNSEIVKDLIDSLSKKFNPDEGEDGTWEDDPNSDIYKPGTPAHRRVFDEIMNGDFTPTEKELLFKMNKIPMM